MKTIVLLVIICCPAFLFAQKGTIKPDTNPKVPAINSSTSKNNTPSHPNDTKIKIVEDKSDSASFGKINQTPDPDVKKRVPVNAKNTTANLTAEMEILKKQLSDLKKQVVMMQLQLDMQLQLFQKNK